MHHMLLQTRVTSLDDDEPWTIARLAAYLTTWLNSLTF
jgi:hypothetical protein